MDKLLVLVAGHSNLPFIKAAKDLGFYVITCDNNKDNPGHQLSDEQLLIDVYDYQAIIKTVADKQIKFVFSFVSAHGVVSAAKIAEHFNLDGYTTASIEILTNKEKFRNFLLKNTFNCPVFQCVEHLNEINFDEIYYPVIIKPTDSGGSLGVKKINSYNELVSYFNVSLNASLEKKVIIEECIDSDVLINGDCFFVDGKLVASLIGDYIYDREVNNVLPIATVFPTNNKIDTALQLITEIATILSIPNGIINFEAIIKDEKVYIIEINPRPSGNHIWRLMEHMYNFDFPTMLLRSYTNNFTINAIGVSTKSYSYQLIYSDENKMYHGFQVPQQLKNNVLEMMLFHQHGLVNRFNSLYDRIGIVLLEFQDDKQRSIYMDNVLNFKL